MSEYSIMRITQKQWSTGQNLKLFHKLCHTTALYMRVVNSHPNAAYARGQLMSFLRGRSKGLGSKRTLWSKLAERSLGSRGGTRQQERHGGQPNLQEKSAENWGHKVYGGNF